MRTDTLCLLQCIRAFYSCHQPVASSVIKTILWAPGIGYEKGDTDLWFPVCYEMWCDIVIYDKRYICPPHPHFPHPPKKLLVFPRMRAIKLSVVMLMR